MKFKRSLLRRLIIGQLMVVIVFSLIAMGNVVWQIYRKDGGEYDLQLTAAAMSMLAVLETKKDTPALLLYDMTLFDSLSRAGITYEKAERAHGETAVDIVIRLTDRSGQEIFRTPDRSHLPMASLPPGSGRFRVGNRQWRASTVQSKDRSLTLQVAQTSDVVDDGLTEVIGMYILWPLLLFLPIAALMTWLATARGLSPLNDLAELISHRSPVDLKPLEHVAAYSETEPLINEINSLLHKLNTTLTRERNFLADAAHELRTPLAVIQAQAHVLRHAATEMEKNAASSELNLGIGRAASLIQKLLLTARVSVEDFVPRFESTDLTALVQERIATFSVLAAEKRIDMELQAPPRSMVEIDRETFVSAVDNVLDNAIRYAPVGGAIVINISPLPDGALVLRIADNGVGIAPELYERVFERFYRVAGTEQQGSGLGLAIVKRVLALHGGKVTLSTGINRRGLTVNLFVPLGH